MKTIEEIIDTLDKIKLSIEEIKSRFKEAQMKPQQDTTTKPFDIDRCLNEDGGRCIYAGKERILLSDKINCNDALMTFVEQGKFFESVKLGNLQNIPKRKEEWINIWRDEFGRIECSIGPHESKQRAIYARGISADPLRPYIGDPICISSEEV